MSRRSDTTPGTGKPAREQRPYPHGSGDRNRFSPSGKDRMPIHRGGTQRHAPPEPDAQSDKDTPSR